MKRKTILYIGNDLVSKSKYNSTMETLTSLLEKENYIVIKSSSKVNKISRVFDMIFTVVKQRNKIDYLLIDTFSTLNFYYAFIISQLSRFFDLKYIPILHGGNLPKRLKASKRISKLIFNHSVINIAPSGYLKYEFEKEGYKTELIPNVILIDNYNYIERINIQPKLLFVRSFASIYNPIMAVKVLYELKKKYKNAILCMVGPDKDGSLLLLKELVKELNLIDSIEFTGVLAKEKWHKKSEEYDIFINTTNIDNTPVSVIEAMALGLPVVSTNVGGIPYLIENSVDGVLVEKANIMEMVTAIERILNNEYQSLAKNARKKVEQFEWNVVRNMWTEILK